VKDIADFRLPIADFVFPEYEVQGTTQGAGRSGSNSSTTKMSKSAIGN
jgi:hypothetical protein